MKTLARNDLVIQSFVNNIHIEAKNKTGSLYFRYNQLFSYSPHFIIATKNPVYKQVVITNAHFSNTTTRQINATIKAFKAAGWQVIPFKTL